MRCEQSFAEKEDVREFEEIVKRIKLNEISTNPQERLDPESVLV